MGSLGPGFISACFVTSVLTVTLAAGAGATEPGGNLTARVVVKQGQPVLEVNGRPLAPLMLFVNLTGANPEGGLSTVRRAAAAGINIVSFVNHAFPLPRPGEPADYSSWDAQVEAIVLANPNALLIPRFGMDNVPGWWAQENAEEMMLYENGERGMPSMASQKWKRDAGEAMRLLVRHLEQKYGDHMLGYHPCGQHTGEWFYDRSWEGLLTGFEAPMTAAFRQWIGGDEVTAPTAGERHVAGLGALLDPAAQRRLVDFLAFEQAAMVEPLEYFARIIKQETAGRKLVVYFYGYVFELSALPAGPSASGHLALARLLECKDVDIVCSPISYGDRQPGGAGMFMAAVDSVQLHGKLWLNEDDTRTYLSTPEDGYGRAATLQETLAVHDRNLARIAVRGAACWWMDLPGAGWLDSVEIWDNCGRLKRLYDSLAPARRPYRPEVAVVVDEESLLHLAYGRQVSMPLVHEIRRELYRMGVPLGFYLLSDVCAGKVPWPKVYIFLDAIALDEAQRRALVQQVRQPGKTAVWFYIPGFIAGTRASAELTSELIGMEVREETAPVSAQAIVSREAQALLPGVRVGEEFGPAEALSPLLYVTDVGARPLATYLATGRIAAALKRIGGATSVFIGTLRATPSLLREVARLAGAHAYLRSDDFVMADSGIVAVHAASEGEKVLALPETCVLRDALSGAEVAPSGKRLRLQMRQGETRVFVRETRR